MSYAKEINNYKSIKDYIISELEEYTDSYAPKFVERVLNKGHSVLFLDSLDEVPVSLREKVVNDISNFCGGFPECKVIISCRIADYGEFFENFYEVELQRLTNKAVNRIITAWFSDEPERGKDLSSFLKQDKAVEALCETPLLLSLICIQFRHDLSLPKRKAELYRRCIDAFLRDWDAGRGFRRETAYSSLSDDRKVRIFENVAGKYFTGDVRYSFPQVELHNLIGDQCELYQIPKGEGPNVLREIETHHGILERFSADSFMFSHPSFQEYFVARYLLAHRIEYEAIKEHFSDERWVSVIEFVVALHNDPSPLLQFLANKSEISNVKNFPTMARRTRIAWLLYRCLATGAAIPQKTRSSLYQQIVDLHFQMAAIFTSGGVFPVPVLMEDGVRHSYVYFRRRPTLHQALQPLRLLANEILHSPSEEYIQCAVERLDEAMTKRDGVKEFERVSTTLCLAVPLANSRPKEVREILNGFKEISSGLFRPMIEETLNIIEQKDLK